MWPLALGGLAPDLPMLVFYAWEKQDRRSRAPTACLATIYALYLGFVAMVWL